MAADIVKLQPDGDLALRSEPDSRPPQKRRKVLFNDEDSANDSDSSGQPGGVTVTQHRDISKGASLQVNEGYARRFEYNKRREEFRRRKPRVYTVWHFKG